MKQIEQIKYYIETPKRYLCMKGFVLKSNFENQTIRLFTSKQQAETYITTGNYTMNLKYEIRKVKVVLQVIE